MLAFLSLLLGVAAAVAATYAVGVTVPVLLVAAAMLVNKGATDWHNSLTRGLGLVLMLGALVLPRVGMDQFFPGALAVSFGLLTSGGGWRGS